MKTEFREAWTADLRSGEHRQGCDHLNRDGLLCCLGVLCETVLRLGYQLDKRQTASGVTYNGSDGYLPDAVVELTGLNGPNPVASLPYDIDFTMTDANDICRFTFPQIADIIDYAFREPACSTTQ